MACFAKLFHKNNGFNPTNSKELPKVPDKSKEKETGRYISKPEGSIRFIDPDNTNPSTEQNHQKITLNHNYTEQNFNTNTNTILDITQNTNTITNPSVTNINKNSINNNIIQIEENQIILTTTHLNIENNENLQEKSQTEQNIVKELDTKPTNNKVISIKTNSSFTTTTTTNNTNENIKNSKKIDNNEIVQKIVINSKQETESTNTINKTTTNNKNLTINSITNTENVSHTKDMISPNTTIQQQQTNKNYTEKLLRNHQPSTSVELNSNTNSVVRPVEISDSVNRNVKETKNDIQNSVEIIGVNPKIKESKNDKQKTLQRPVITTTTIQPIQSPTVISSGAGISLNPYDKIEISIEKLQKKIMTKMASDGHTVNNNIKNSSNNIILKNQNKNTVSVVNLPILGAHIIGNKDYEERRQNRILQPQYGISTKVTAPLYLEELKKKQQQQHNQQKNVDEIKCQRKMELNNNSNYKNGYNSWEYQELTDKNNNIFKNERCNPTGLTTLITDISGTSTESIIDGAVNSIIADIENTNFIKISNNGIDDIDCDGDIMLPKISNDVEENFKINNNGIGDDDDDKINELAKLSDTINEVDINKETKTENSTQTNNNKNRYLSTVSILDQGHASGEINRKEGIFVRRPVALEENIPVYKKDEQTTQLIKKAIENNDFLNNYMDEDRKNRVIDAMEPAYYDKGKFIIRENEEGSEIYVSDDGVFDVIKNNDIINTLGSGIVFGELAILYNAKRFASIRAATTAKVWKIDRTKFRTIMKISGSKEREENLAFLKTAPFLKELREEILLKVVDLLVRRFFPANTCIIRQFDVGDDFYIIRGGTVTIKKCNELGDEYKVNRLKRGDYFGEQALLNRDVRSASVYADDPGTECLKLDRVNFISYLGTIPELQERPIDRNVVPDINPTTLNTPYDYIQLKDLKRITSLGAGAFGRVDLVTYQNNESFALKVIKKIDVVKQGQSDHIYNEKLVMSMCHCSPFIVELYKTYRDTKYVYFLMEACLGGDVWTIMYQMKHFDEKTARFISGCVVEAFDFLHSRNIIFRDLKPENLMLTTEGYCKLVDFGFAKRLSPNYKTNTFAGTPEYVAPEIILDRGHDRAADYWALGILIYELLIGRTPFRDKNQMKIYQNILAGINAIKMPPKIPKSAQHLIKHLCKQLPAERLGYQRKGIMDIKKHSWFDSFDWNRLQNQTMSSPIKRPINSIIDTQYFPGKFEIDSDVPPDELSGWDINF